MSGIEHDKKSMCALKSMHIHLNCGEDQDDVIFYNYLETPLDTGTIPDEPGRLQLNTLQNVIWYIVNIKCQTLIS